MWVVAIYLISERAIELDLIAVFGPELTWFSCRCRKILDFSVCIELYLVLCRGIQIELIVE